MATLVDSNVLLDVITDDPTWSAWSAEHLAHAAQEGPLVLNPIVQAEVSIRFSRVEDLDHVVADLVREPLPWAAGFLAGKAFTEHSAAVGRAGRSCPTSWSALTPRWLDTGY